MGWCSGLPLLDCSVLARNRKHALEDLELCATYELDGLVVPGSGAGSSEHHQRGYDDGYNLAGLGNCRCAVRSRQMSELDAFDAQVA